jgi:diaminopimelate epimerase
MPLIQGPIEFVKLSGSGNDFVCIDNRGGRFDPLLETPSRIGTFARALCSRGMGVGADGVIFACRVEDGVDADIAARFLEADGSEAELCGNGTAVFVRWAVANQWFGPPAQEPPGADPLNAFGNGATDAEIRVLTQAGIVRGKPVDGLYIRVCIPLPHDMRLAQEIKLARRVWQYDYVVTGVPHAVAQVSDVDRADVAKWGPAFRHNGHFQPRGVNANFVQVLGEGRLAIRTFEFGVEAETLACGTGCAAAAILSTIRQNWPAAYRQGDEPVLLRTHGGDVLRVYFKLQADNSVTDLCLDTIVRYAFGGTLHPQLIESAMGGE